MNAPADLNQPPLDLSQLALDRSPQSVSSMHGVSKPSRYHRMRPITRYVVPIGIVLGFVALLVAAAGRQWWPSTSVTVIPVIVKRADVQQTGMPVFRSPGWIEPRPTAITVAALAAGVIEELLVVEGQEMAALKARVNEEPKNAKLREEIRLLDQRLREEMFRRELVARRGGWMLVVGLAVFVVSMQLAHHYSGRPLPTLSGGAEDRRKESMKSGRALAVVLLGLFSFAAVLVGNTSPRWGRLALAVGEKAVPDADVPTEDPWYASGEELTSNWWRFRGPGGLGVYSFEGIPTKWNGESGEGITWKTEVGLPGEGSPVVWGDRIFMIGATVKAREVCCYDLGTGELKWRKSVSTPEGSRADWPSVMDMTGYASSTPVTTSCAVIFSRAGRCCPCWRGFASTGEGHPFCGSSRRSAQK